MKKFTRWCIAGLTTLAVVGLLFLGNYGNAGSAGKLKSQVQELADAIAKGKDKDATKLAEKIADDEGEVYGAMLLFKPRDKKGFGVEGSTQDGIELKVRALSRDLISAAKLKSESDALIEMAQRIRAINMISHALPPKKDKTEWIRYCEDTEKASTDFIAAVKSGSTAEVKSAASKINTNCNNCHSKFR